MGRHDAPADGQPQAQPAWAGVAFPRADAVEAREDRLQLVGRDARPFVEDGDLDPASYDARLGRDPAARRRVVDGVLPEVAEHLADPPVVEAAQRQVGGQGDDEQVRLEEVLREDQLPLDDLRERSRAELDPQRSGLDARGVEQVLHQA
jgi:hypothetical protein